MDACLQEMAADQLIREADEHLLRAIRLYREGVQKLCDERRYAEASKILREQGIYETAKTRLDPSFDPTEDRKMRKWVCMMEDCCNEDGVLDKRKLLKWYMENDRFEDAIKLMTEEPDVGDGIDLALCQIAHNSENNLTRPLNDRQRSFIEGIETAIDEANEKLFLDVWDENIDLLGEEDNAVLSHLHTIAFNTNTIVEDY